MIGKIIEWSADNKFLVLFITGFALLGSLYCIQNIPLDAVPDLSDTQVIIYSKWDRSPDVIEDQVTYPIVTALLGSPKVKTVRGITDFGYSYVYVIFEEGTDLYWARSRIVESLNKILPKLPSEVKTEIGPDATSVGWVYQYSLVDDSHKLNLAELRSIQDWQLKFSLQSVPGVAEVGSVGGFVKQYQINVDPNRLQTFGVGLNQLVNSVRDGNSDTGGRVIEFSGREYMVRGRGYAHSISDLENIVVGTDHKTGVPILVKQLARVELGPDIRRGVTDLNGLGDAPSGIIIMRQGENALRVIDNVKAKINEIKPSLPEGVRIVPTYDRSNLIKDSIHTLKHELTLEIIIVSLVILVFLWHIPSAIVPIATIPISVMLSFIPLYFLGITSNIMSLAGIAISIGVLVDGAIVEVENAYKKLEIWSHTGRKGDFHTIRLEALKEVAPSIFFSLLVIAVSFLPIFTLIDQEGRLFRPLAFSKTLAMIMASIIAVTVDPAMRMLFTRMEAFNFKSIWFNKVAGATFVGTYYSEEKHPISRRLFKIYEPTVYFVIKNSKVVLAVAALLILTTIPVFLHLGTEFMPPLNEGAFLYMPTALPGMAVGEARRLLQIQDKILKEFPEVESVFGKAGRAETSTDSAPFSMVETTVVLKPQSEWPPASGSWFWKTHKSFEALQQEMNEKLKFAGIPNIWTMPIKNRIDMLSTGMRTPVGVKVSGPDLRVIQELSENIESVLRDVRGTRSVFAERTNTGYYLDFKLKREELARYGISVSDAQMVINSAVGGENISQVFEGRERYPINVRYAREFRDDIESLKRVLVPMSNGGHIPMAQIAEIKMQEGPAMIRDENGLLTGYVYVDAAERDLGGYVNDAKAVVESKIKIPKGYHLVWSGQYENIARVKKRLQIVIPLALILISILLFLNTKSVVKTSVILLAVPFSLIGAVWLLFFLGYNMSIAVWVGMIALMGLDAETGVFMLMYLDMAFDDATKLGKMKNDTDLTAAIVEGAVKRIRPKLMTVAAAFMGLLPIMFSDGAGSDMMKRVAAPMVGGLATSFALELLIYPAIYHLWRKRSLPAV